MNAIGVLQAKKRFELIRTEDASEKSVLYGLLDKSSVKDAAKFFSKRKSKEGDLLIKYSSKFTEYLLYCAIDRAVEVFDNIGPLSKKAIFLLRLHTDDIEKTDKITQIVARSLKKCGFEKTHEEIAYIFRIFNDYHSFTEEQKKVFDSISAKDVVALSGYMDIFFLCKYLQDCELARAVQIFNFLPGHYRYSLLRTWRDSPRKFAEILADKALVEIFGNYGECANVVLSSLSSIINTLPQSPENVSIAVDILLKINSADILSAILDQINEEEVIVGVMSGVDDVSAQNLVFLVDDQKRELLLQRHSFLLPLLVGFVEANINLIKSGDQFDLEKFQKFMVCLGSNGRSKDLLKKHLFNDGALNKDFLKLYLESVDVKFGVKLIELVQEFAQLAEALPVLTEVQGCTSTSRFPELFEFMTEEIQLEILKCFESYSFEENVGSDQALDMLSSASEVVYSKIVKILPPNILKTAMELSTKSKREEFLFIRGPIQDDEKSSVFRSSCPAAFSVSRFDVRVLDISKKENIVLLCNYFALAPEVVVLDYLNSLDPLSIYDIGIKMANNTETEVTTEDVLRFWGLFVNIQPEKVVACIVNHMDPGEFKQLLDFVSFAKAKEVLAEVFKVNTKKVLLAIEEMPPHRANTFRLYIDTVSGFERGVFERLHDFPGLKIRGESKELRAEGSDLQSILRVGGGRS